MADQQQKLLVVDDDAELQELIAGFLAKQGYEVVAVGDGRAMDEALVVHHIDLVVLDLMLPGEDGLSIAKRIKSDTNIPIIIVSAQGDDVDRIAGLEVGADDYMGKPFNPRELLARVRAVLRRVRSEKSAEAEVVEFGDFQLDLKSQQLSKAGQSVGLTSGEYDLLEIFARHPNRVLDRDRLLDLLIGAERSPFDRRIDVRIARLRQKIEPLHIRTVWGKGYMFCTSTDRG